MFPVEAHTLPGVEAAAAVIHEGGRDTLALAYRALADWVTNNGYRVAGPFQENVLREGGAPLIELAIPVEKI
jgi:effector-binding domain-containing protein